jgi:predicted DsbA family dithiol-disulfide isomerase
MDTEGFFGRLDTQWKSMGVRFNLQPLMSNSRLALEAGEFAKAHGVYDKFHTAVFKAFFTECKDIGQREVIIDIAASLGLDTDQLTLDLDNHTYLNILEETTQSARSMMVSAAPTFVIDGLKPITGAQPLDSFRTLLGKLQS